MVRKQRARELRKRGLSIIDIAKKVGATKSSVSLWVRDLPTPEKFTQEYREKLKKEKEKIRKEKREKKE